ncbi:MAG: Gfo/Idh/MocA family oxidoreductase [Aliiglaciecola sp.]
MLRWGLIGCGDVSEKKSGPAYHLVEGFELYAVSARSPGKAEDYAKRHQISCFYNDAIKLINDPKVDAVYIATPPDSHLSLALDVAKAGKICCIEKPMAVNFSQCQQILKAFEPTHLPCFVAYYRRCLPGFKQIKSWLDDGLIGRVSHVNWQYSRAPSELDKSGTPNWRTQHAIAPGGYFDDLASHGIDILTFLLGPIVSAKGMTTNILGLYSSADAVVANWLFENGATGVGAWHFATELYQDKVQILGDKGHIEFGVFAETPAKLVSEAGTIECDMPKPDPIQGPFVQAIADHLNHGIQHPSTAFSAAHTSWVMDHILGTLA